MKRIIDNRIKEKFLMDDEYLNGQAKLCGWQATIAYMSLCRHSNKEQECFPSIKLIADENGVGRDTIIKGLSKLEKRNVIKIKKQRTNGGTWLNNTYILIDKSQWDYNQVDNTDTVNQVDVSVSPSRPHRLDQVGHTDTKETHYKETHIKETHKYSELSSQVNKVMDVFSKINPSLNWGNKTTRGACEWMIKRFGLDGTISMACQIVSVQGEKFVPVATTPYQMKEKLAQFKIYFDTKKNNQSKITTI